jgi:hypothetical protein
MSLLSPPEISSEQPHGVADRVIDVSRLVDHDEEYA